MKKFSDVELKQDNGIVKDLLYYKKIRLIKNNPNPNRQITDQKLAIEFAKGFIKTKEFY